MSSPEHESSGRYDDVLTTHNYDGIQEYDNPMPSWWTWIFIATCVWAAVYFVGINMDFIPDTHDRLAVEMESAAELEAALAAEVPPMTPEMLAEAAADDGMATKGSEVFAMNCASCHGNQGQGLIGPNLTDNAWLYGGSLSDIHTQVEKGKPDKGMPAWGDILLREDQLAVVAYIDSIRGTNPPDAKAPEGEPWEGAEGEADAESGATGDDGGDGEPAEEADTEADGAEEPSDESGDSTESGSDGATNGAKGS